MSPKDATFKAMEEVSGPVVAIAIILSAVFLPTVFIPGITGRLYQQFAVTIAISVLISAFNALTLSPALSAACCCGRRRKATGPLGKFFDWFNRGYGRVTRRLRRHCAGLDPKVGLQPWCSSPSWPLAAGWFGKKLPAGFLPEEDQGICYVNVQLPFAASLERTAAVCKTGRGDSGQTPGVKYCTTVAGFSLLSFSRNTYSAFFWVTLKDWDERTQTGGTVTTPSRRT